MAQYTERVQTVLTRTQYEYLRKLADEEHKPISKLIREAIEEFYFVQIEKDRRRQAL
ncbi:MAG: ribbon-helix-helix protein, CopG family, partial [Anaerolineales bacterium]|nr:ribbon-helix-helix protein, CopG family [Anaerolineales bacterium]